MPKKGKKAKKTSRAKKVKRAQVVKKGKKGKKEKKGRKKVVLAKKGYKHIYFFGGGRAEGGKNLKDLLGGKGSGLAEMTNIGIPVPPGFTITTEVCNLFYQNDMRLPKELQKELKSNMSKLEKIYGAEFGNTSKPLLLSVRSGAKFSMPGMMDTILNLGLNDKTVQGLIKKTGNERFAYDSYRRFIQMFGNVVMGLDKAEFEEIIQKRKDEKDIKLDISLTVDDLKQIIQKYKNLIKRKTGEEFPQEVYKQLEMSIEAVFKSWNNPRAIHYRKLNHIPGDLGTAVNIQIMVFGNMGENSCTGVGFTRNPSTGEKKFYGEFLVNAQGEDVVAGIRTPKPIEELESEMPQVFKELKQITTKLEKHYRDIQDFEFTVQENKLYMLQTRTGKRTAPAAVKIAVDMVKEKLITRDEALMRIEPAQLDQLLHKRIDPKAQVNVVAKGLAASPGAATGKVVFTAEDAVKLAQAGEKVILVRQETNPDDIQGMAIAQGILTARGGMTSHAAVVARGMGKCCVAGCEEIKVNEQRKVFSVGGLVIRERDIISLNGSTGEVILGEVPTIDPELTGEFGEFMKWADEVRELKVRTNADIPRDAEQAMKFGAEGIGLCRTEHMFFAKDRLPIVQRMILAKDPAEREMALDQLLPFQKSDFKGLFEAMKGYPVTIRTLDPPLHEFLPSREELMVEIAVLKAKEEDEEKIKEKEELLARIEELHEFNPMLGHRGCRLGIVHPEITQMQVRAIFEAACELARSGKTVVPEVMIPLVGSIKEFENQKEVVVRVAEETMKKYKVRIKYLVGTMVEIPRACLTADEIASGAEFFSFGTNDLTQTVYGFSRDDSGKFIKYYLEHGILRKDPFVSIDVKGVGQLMELGVKKGKSTRPDLKVGICGEHGGDPDSILLCHKLGLNYVSCSPFRVPIARLAAAQAALGRISKEVTE